MHSASTAGPRRVASCFLKAASLGCTRTFSPAHNCQSSRSSRASRASSENSRLSPSWLRESSFHTALRLPASMWRMQSKTLHSGFQDAVAVMARVILPDSGVCDAL